MNNFYKKIAKLTWQSIVCWLIILVPFFVTLGFVLAYGVNMVFMDEWELVRLFRALNDGTFSIADLWEQHNEHRIFFVSALTVVLGSLTHWNLNYQMLVSVGLTLITLAIIGFYTKKEYRRSRTQYVMYLTMISALLFSMIQWENWLRGFQMQK